MTVMGGPPGTLPATLSLPVGMLVASLDSVAAQPPAELSAEQALLEASVLLAALDQLRAVALARVADIDIRQLHTLDGSPSTSSWVAEQHTGMDRSQVALARKLQSMPQIAARIAAGEISVDCGVLVGKALSRVRRFVDRPDGLIDGQPAEDVLGGVIVNGVGQLVAEAHGGLADDHPLLAPRYDELRSIYTAPLPELARLEAAFLLVARHVEPHQLPRALACLVDAVLPSQLADRADDAHRERGLDLIRDVDGSGWLLRGRLDAETGELMHTVMTAAMATDPDNPADTAADAELRAQGLDPYEDGCLRRRSTTQRRHDALRLVLRKVIGSKVLGSRGKAPVNMSVTISEDALHERPGALPARGASGATLPVGLVRRWLCDSSITRFVLSLGHRVLESSHTERTLKPHERRIKHLETGGLCQAAGCSRGDPTGHTLIPHHVTPYAVCGTTSLTDTVLLCDVSHHDVHEGGKTLRLKDGRYFNAVGWTDGRPGR